MRLINHSFGVTGYSPEYVEEVLHKKKAERATLAIDLQRPTFIKVNRKYLHPDTLDFYGLPWEWDSVCTTLSFALPPLDVTRLALWFLWFAALVLPQPLPVRRPLAPVR